MFLTMSTNCDICLNAGETDFTHATQDRDHGAPESQRRTVGPTDYDTPLYSSSSYSDTSQSFHYPRSDINMQPPTRWVYEWKDPHFYNMLLQQCRRQQRGLVKLGKTTRLSCLECKV
jgi:hypothetical protein